MDPPRQDSALGFYLFVAVPLYNVFALIVYYFVVSSCFPRHSCYVPIVYTPERRLRTIPTQSSGGNVAVRLFVVRPSPFHPLHQMLLSSNIKMKGLYFRRAEYAFNAVLTKEWFTIVVFSYTSARLRRFSEKSL